MIYRAENRLKDFEFHDAWFKLDRFDSSGLTVSADHVNVHKTAGYGVLEHDMEMNSAKITFEDFRAVTFEPGRAWTTDDDGRSYTDDPLIVFEGREAEKEILEELQGGINIYGLGQEKENQYYIEGCGIEPFFTMILQASGVTVEWNGYRKKAGYELHRQYQREAVLLRMPDGRRQVNVHVIYHDEDVCYQGTFERSPQVLAGIKYDGKELWGRGGDEKSAFSALQKQLPKDVILIID